MTNQLPPDFADLEPWADWALPTEPERYAKRLASPFGELQAFYDAAFPAWRMLPPISSGCRSTISPMTPPDYCSSPTR